MIPRFSLTSVRSLAGAAVLLAFAAAAAAAQVTSSRRIPISKEGPAPRVDTVTVYKTDTLRVPGPTEYVHDTVRVPGPTTTTIVHDTVAVAPRPMPVRLPYGLYFGVAGGASTPDGALFIPNSTGWTVQGQVGWQGAKNLLGVRGDVNYAHPGQDSQFAGLQGDPSIWNFSADAKLQLPFFNHLFGQARRFALYGVGGYTFTTYKNLPMRLDNGSVVAGSPDWSSHSGFNAGGGASLMWARTELFVESRVLFFTANAAPQSRQIPVVFGINLY